MHGEHLWFFQMMLVSTDGHLVPDGHLVADGHLVPDGQLVLTDDHLVPDRSDL
jgi:hypothetical protein